VVLPAAKALDAVASELAKAAASASVAAAASVGGRPP